MMEDHKFCDTCEGCRPAMVNTKTGKVVPKDDPMMVAISECWVNETTYAQRKAYIEVTLHNSRNPHDIRLFQKVAGMIQTTLDKLGKS